MPAKKQVFFLRIYCIENLFPFLLLIPYFLFIILISLQPIPVAYFKHSLNRFFRSN